MTEQEPLPGLSDSSGAPQTGLERGPAGDVVERAFGESNRATLLEQYFTSGFGSRTPLTAVTAWEHTYRLLLWIDRTTNLAHCYESDKCQPGRPWYARSLAFHYWLAESLEVPPGDVGQHIDTLFRQVTEDLAIAATARLSERMSAAATQRAPYEGLDLPEPGNDPQLEEIITETLAPHLAEAPPSVVLRTLTERITAYVAQENKRKNLVGEGFEDTLDAILRRLPGITERFDVRVRPLLHELPGFNRPRGTEKPRQVDLALVDRGSGQRILISCKWSVRSDREEQFGNDFRAYAALESAGQDFDYVLATNEFDPARLAAACEMRRENAPLFSCVVHVNIDGPLAAYAGVPGTRARGGITRVREHINTGRLASLGTWLGQLGVT